MKGVDAHRQQCMGQLLTAVLSLLPDLDHPRVENHAGKPYSKRLTDASLLFPHYFQVYLDQPALSLGFSLGCSTSLDFRMHHPECCLALFFSLRVSSLPCP